MMTQGRESKSVAQTARRRRDSVEDEKRAQRRAIISVLVADQGHEDFEIGDILRDSYGIKVGRSTVTRDLQWIKKNRWIETRLGSECPGKEHLQAIKQTAQFYGGLQEVLRERSNGTLKSFHVFWGGPIAKGEDGWDDRLSRFAARAAPTLLELLPTGQRIGVSFGTTIGVCIEALASAAARARARTPRELMVIPTSGEPLGGAKAPFASTDLAEHLREILGGPHVPSLRGMAPVIPEKFYGYTHAAGFAHMRCYTSYKTIFGDSSTEGLVDELDTVLTSAGGFGEHYHAFQNGVVENLGFTREQVGEVAEGDICGVLMGKNEGLTKAQEKMLDGLRKLWTGIRLEHLRRISANARDHQHPGVILCALGANKADIVQAVVCREKLVNHLIIDETLAARLQELLNLPTFAAA